MSMTLPRLQHLLDARGADVSRWPATERRAAEQLIAGDPAAAAALMQACSLDRLISRAVSPADTDSDRVVAALTARPLPRQRRPWLRWPIELLNFDFAPAWPRLTALACVGVLGFLIGMTDVVAPIDSDTQGAETIVAVAGEPDIGSLLFGPDSLTEIGQ